MYTRVNFSDFCDAFAKMGRDDNFSYDGKQALFQYLEDIEDGTGERIELDVIALCCEYTEFEDWDDFCEQYSDIEDMGKLRDHTTVIETDGDAFIIQDF